MPVCYEDILPLDRSDTKEPVFRFALALAYKANRVSHEFDCCDPRANKGDGQEPMR